MMASPSVHASPQEAVMLGTSRIMAFLPIRDAERARTFYQGVLGLKLIEDASFALVFDVGGTQLRLQKMQEFTPHPFTALGWSVVDIESVVDALVSRGVEFQRYQGMHQDARGIWDSGAARIAWFAIRMATRSRSLSEARPAVGSYARLFR
jgi:catechol 2,3-dioxygenase-like lactoylglutathione lyase family enzyme